MRSSSGTDRNSRGCFVLGQVIAGINDLKSTIQVCERNLNPISSGAGGKNKGKFSGGVTKTIDPTLGRQLTRLLRAGRQRPSHHPTGEKPDHLPASHENLPACEGRWRLLRQQRA